jgi:hypothetical protein
MKKLLVTIMIGLFFTGCAGYSERGAAGGPLVAPSPCRWTSNGIECDGNRDGTADLLINKSDGTVEISSDVTIDGTLTVGSPSVGDVPTGASYEEYLKVDALQAGYYQETPIYRYVELEKSDAGKNFFVYEDFLFGLPDADGDDVGELCYRFQKRDAADSIDLRLQDATELFVLQDGTELDADDMLSLAGGAGSWVEVCYVETGKWYIHDQYGTSTDGGPDDLKEYTDFTDDSEWSSDDLVNYTEVGESGSDPLITQTTGGARLYTSSTYSRFYKSITGLTAETTYDCVVYCPTYVSGTANLQESSGPTAIVSVTGAGTFTGTYDTGVGETSFNIQVVRGTTPTDLTIGYIMVREQ